MILLLRTDKPEAELYIYDGKAMVDSLKWEAHRQLAETIHVKIAGLLKRNGMDWGEIAGIGCFEGPGSFTGLRIGLSVGNALADSLQVSIVAAGGENWIEVCIKKLLNGENQHIAKPDYGRPARITQQKK
jgi:tRNA threonylcarbamoyladenosine biosynthesis protein TsaB